MTSDPAPSRTSDEAARRASDRIAGAAATALESEDGRQSSLRELEIELAVMVQRLRRVIRRRAEELHPDLSARAYMILSYLYNRGPVRASDLVTDFVVDKGAISRQVQQLVDIGLIERVSDPDDGRAHLLMLPESTRQRLREQAADRRRRLDQKIGGWSEDEIASFVAHLRAYNDAVELTL